MTLRQNLEAQVIEAQRQLAILDNIDEDIFNFGTVAVFSAPSHPRWYYVKVAEESWKSFTNGTQKALADWIFEAEESNVGYFEVYMMTAAPDPFYASSDV